MLALQQATPLYKQLKHTNLIELVDDFAVGELYVAVFAWAEGDCLYDYWNFEKYNKLGLLSPMDRYKKLSLDKRIKSFKAIFEFLLFVEQKGYVAIDFYDGSILYDFLTDETMICDIDFFREKPTTNDMGINFWGTKRLKAPEEYMLGAPIDERTNVFTVGALLFHVFGNYKDEEVEQIYKSNQFKPCSFENWDLSRELYDIAVKAISLQRGARFGSVQEFFAVWQANV